MASELEDENVWDGRAAPCRVRQGWDCQGSVRSQNVPSRVRMETRMGYAWPHPSGRASTVPVGRCQCRRLESVGNEGRNL